MITKAIILVAGWGTRRLPVTKTIEKCMLPIGNRPVVDYVVQDCIAAGITEIYFVVNEGSTQLQDYYGRNGALETYLIANNKEDMLPLVTPPKNVQFHYVPCQGNAKYGTAAATALAVPYIGQGESAVVVTGDDFIYSPDGSSEIARLVTATPENGNALLGVNVPRQAVSHYGVIDMDDNQDFVRIVEKPAPEQAPSTLINVSKYVFNYDLLKAVENYAGLALSGEYYITEPINQYVMNGGSVRIVPATGEYLDGGNLNGWLHANNVIAGQGFQA